MADPLPAYMPLAALPPSWMPSQVAADRLWGMLPPALRQKLVSWGSLLIPPSWTPDAQVPERYDLERFGAEERPRRSIDRMGRGVTGSMGPLPPPSQPEQKRWGYDPRDYPPMGNPFRVPGQMPGESWLDANLRYYGEQFSNPRSGEAIRSAVNTVADMTPPAAFRDAVLATGDIGRAIVDLDPSGVVGGLGTVGWAAMSMPPGARFPKAAQARALGFRPAWAAEIDVIPPGEKIQGAAIKTADGRVYGPAPTHMHLVDEIERKTGKYIGDVPLPSDADGFLTTSGRYVTRDEGMKIAKNANQYLGKPGAFEQQRGLAAESIRPGSGVQVEGPVAAMENFPLLGQPVVVGRRPSRSSNSRAADPASRLPDPASDATSTRSPTTAVAWPRARKPVQMDAQDIDRGSLAREVRSAWDEGHDLLIIRNYRAPGAKESRDILLTRNANQWRFPDAEFDPKRLDSANLTAGLVPIAIGGSVFWVWPDQAAAASKEDRPMLLPPLAGEERRR